MSEHRTTSYNTSHLPMIRLPSQTHSNNTATMARSNPPRAPSAVTSAGSRVVRGVNLDQPDPMKRVNEFLAEARGGVYDVPPSIHN